MWEGNVTYNLDMRNDYNNKVVVWLRWGGDANLNFYGVDVLNVVVLFREEKYFGWKELYTSNRNIRWWSKVFL
jgi:hypothetical protein